MTSEEPSRPTVALSVGATGGAPASADRRRHDVGRRALDQRVLSVRESVTHAFLTLDARWGVTYANREAARLNGTTPDALIGRDHWALWPEALGSEVERRYRRVAGEGVAEHFVHHYPLADAWHEIHAYPSGDGGVAVLYRDISAERRATAERARLTAELQRRERELATLLEHATDVVVRLDADGRILYANPALRAATGGAPESVVGRRLAELPLPADVAALGRHAVEQALRTGQERTLVFEAPPTSVDDAGRWWEARGVPVPATDGEGPALLVIARDVTERERAARRLAAALADAKAESQAKTRFLAVMSHELRTPLNAIRGYAELMGEGIYGPVTARQQEVLARVRAAERHLVALVSDVLEYARLDGGHARYTLADLPLAALVAEVAAVAEPLAAGKGLAFVVEDATAAPDVRVRADAGKLRQALLNLLSNAVKFTPSGGRIGLAVAADATRVRFTVRDTGPGIDPEARERIFAPFEQLGRAQARALAGVGLGLAISREFARGMGGELTLADAGAPGDDGAPPGATFVLTLPRAG